jgi:low affinity Fe/Cu permease
MRNLRCSAKNPPRMEARESPGRAQSLRLVATLAVWVMTLFIQRSNRRDTLALHAKLDELLRVDVTARSELDRLDEREPEDIVRHRDTEVAKASEKI